MLGSDFDDVAMFESLKFQFLQLSPINSLVQQVRLGVDYEDECIVCIHECMTTVHFKCTIGGQQANSYSSM